MSDEERIEESGEGKSPPKDTRPWRPEEDRARIYKLADDRKKNPYAENAARFFARGTGEEETKDWEWQVRSESEEMTQACEKFLKKNGLTAKSELWRKINDFNFYGKHSDLLAAHEAEDYDGMLRIAKARAEREMELESRQDYIRALQRERAPEGETFEAYRKRMARGGR